MDLVSYLPSIIDESLYEPLLEELRKVCVGRKMKIYGKTFDVKRLSCVYKLSDKPLDGSYGLKALENPPKELIAIKELLEERTGLKMDYVLCHIYRDGNDKIDWHRDEEALGSHILSVSLGATRRFEMKPIEAKKASYTYTLHSGDVIWMEKGCQEVNKHRIPKMSIADVVSHIQSKGYTVPSGRKTFVKLEQFMKDNNIVPTRVNLTFRQL